MAKAELALAQPGARVLVVGTGRHLAGSPLPDVPSVAGTVTDLGQTLVERCGLPAEHLRTLLDPADPISFGSVLTEVAEQAEDIFVLYYVGHGLISPGEELHLATRATDDLSRGLAYKALPYSAVRDALASSPARLVVVILDCCFSGRAHASFGTPVADAFHLGYVRGSYLLASAAADETALAPVGQRHTAFSGELMRLLRAGDPAAPPELTLDHAFRILSRRLPELGLPRPHRQAGDLAGDLVLTTNPAAPEPAGPAAATPGGSPGGSPGDICPYQGLAPFGTEDARFFHGRDGLTQELVRALARRVPGRGPLVVVGPSGAGKSSLLRAGLLPALAAGQMGVPGSHTWPHLVLTPGDDPVRKLAGRLAGPRPAGDVTAALLADPGHLTTVVRQAIQRRAGTRERAGARVVLVVDQFEEVFTACRDESVRLAFLRGLCAASSGPEASALVVLGLRADFFGRCLQYPELVSALTGGQFLIRPMTTDELTDAIRKPAHTAGLALEDGLAERLLADLRAGPWGGQDTGGTLPLLSYALLTTWQHRQGKALTLAGYQRTGGIWAAVATEAERVYAGLDAAGQEAARRLLLRMVRIGDGTEETRRRVELGDAPPGDSPAEAAARERAVAALAAARLITIDAGHVEITHEALLHAWPRLRQWIDEDRASLRLHQQLTEAAAGWLREAREPAALYRGARLDLTREWLAAPGHPAALNALEREFLDASVALHNRERSRTRRNRFIAVTAVVAVLASLVVGVVAQRQAGFAQERRLEAESRRLAEIADGQADTWPREAQLLAAAAWQRSPTREARNALLVTQSRDRLRRVLRGHQGPVQWVEFSPDGSLLASAGEDGTVRLWDAETGRPAAGTITTDGPVNRVAFHPGGHLLAIASTDESLRLWDLAAGRQLWRRQHGAPVVDVAFSGGGDMLVSTNGTPQLWDVDSGQRIGTPLVGARDIITRVHFGPGDSAVIGGGREPAIHVWDTEDQWLLWTIPVSRPCLFLAVDFDGDDAQAACPGPDGIERWDLLTGERIGEPLRGHTGTVYGLTFAYDGQLLASASADRTVRVWFLPTGQQIGQELRGASERTISPGFAPDDRTLAVGTESGEILLWRTLQPVAVGDEASFTAASPDGSLAAYARADGVTLVWGTGTLHHVRSFACGEAGAPVPAFSRDGARLATNCENFLTVWEVSSGATVARFEIDAVRAVLSPDGRTLAAATLTGEVVLLDLVTGRRAGGPLFATDDLGERGDMVWSLRFSPDGGLLATGARNGEIRLWDVAGRAQVGTTLTGHSDTIETLAFHPQGRILASAGWDNTVRLWDLDRDAPIGAPLAGHADRAVSLSFNDDGTLLASAGWDNTPLLWDVQRRTMHAAFNQPGTNIQYVSFAPGDVLIGLSGNGLIMRWVTDPDAVAADICARLGPGLIEEEWRALAPEVPYAPQCRAGQDSGG